VRTQSETVFLLGGLILIFMILVVLVVFLYIAYFRMSEILAHLSKSPAVMYRKKSLGWDPMSRLLLLYCVSAILIFSRQSLKSGDLDLRDYERFPVRLKSMIKVCGCLMLSLAVVSLIVVIVGRYMGWLK
jgi:hypothetical protein